jgi:hypothetical protein
MKQVENRLSEAIPSMTPGHSLRATGDASPLYLKPESFSGGRRNRPFCGKVPNRAKITGGYIKSLAIAYTMHYIVFEE